MAQAVKQTTPATRRGRGKDQPKSNKLGPRSKQDLGAKQTPVGGRDKRATRAAHDSRGERDFSREHDFTDEHHLTLDHADQGPRGENDTQWQPGDRQPADRAERGSRREPRRQPGGVQRSLPANGPADRLDQPTDRVEQAGSTAFGALTPTLDLSAIFTSMYQLAGAMMKVQQQIFASMIGAANTNPDPLTDGARRGNIHDGPPASRMRSLVPDSIEQDRRGTGDETQSQLGVQRDRSEAKSSWDGQRATSRA